MVVAVEDTSVGITPMRALCGWALGLSLDWVELKGDDSDNAVLLEVVTGLRNIPATVGLITGVLSFVTESGLAKPRADLFPFSVHITPRSAHSCAFPPATVLPVSDDVIQLLEDRRTGNGGATLEVGNTLRCDSRTSSISVLQGDGDLPLCPLTSVAGGKSAVLISNR